MADRWLLEDVHRLDQAMIPSLLVLPILLVGLTVGFYLGLVAEGHWKRKPRAPWFVAGLARTNQGDRPVRYGPFHSRWAARVFYKNWTDECEGAVTITRGNPDA